MFESLKWTPAREAESAGALACLSRDTDNRRKCGEAAQALWPAMDARTAGATQAQICSLNHHLQLRRSAMPEPEVNRRPIASRSAEWAKASAAFLARTRVTPNQISAVSVLFAAIGAALLVLKPDAIGLIGCAAAVQARLVCNLLDGMVAIEGGKKSPVGSLYNEFPDRIADSLFIVALGYAIGWPALGWFGALAAALTAYIRVFGGSLGFAQDFRGPMAQAATHGRSHRRLHRCRRRMVIDRHPVCADRGGGHHRRGFGRDVRDPQARHRFPAQGRLAVWLSYLLIGSVRALLGATPRWIGSKPEDRQRIYFANHTSHIDTVALWSALPPDLRAKTRTAAAADYWGTSAIKRTIALKALNAVLIDRKAGGSGRGPAASAL